MPLTRVSLAFASALLALASSSAIADPAPSHRLLTITLPASAPAPVSGRLLVFAAPAKYAEEEAKGMPVDEVDIDQFDPGPVRVSATEISGLVPGGSTTVDVDALAWPRGLSSLAPGKWYLQAVLDVDHSYPYDGRGPGDLTSAVVTLTIGPDATWPSFALTTKVPTRDPWAPGKRAPESMRKALAAARPDVRPIDFVSDKLSAFWGRPIHLLGWVVLPPGYDPKSPAHYPTVYFTHGFTGRLNGLLGQAALVHGLTASGDIPPMIWVLLDESFPSGTHEFADSVNNGPWGAALTEELIPSLERDYRMDAVPTGRFVTGHSSGGWAALWLQTRYPKVFGGAWGTAPDTVDFRDYNTIDLYAPGANLYRSIAGKPIPFMTNTDEIGFDIEASAKLERTLGDYGGQLASFDWVFSPRGSDGRAMPVFDRDSGAIDPDVARYWRDHYDISWIIKRDWQTLRPELDGKLHVIVGSADTFFLDRPVHLLEQVMQELGAKTDFRYPEGRTHFDVYAVGDDRHGLAKVIAREMYAVARPRQPPAGPAH